MSKLGSFALTEALTAMHANGGCPQDQILSAAPATGFSALAEPADAATAICSSESNPSLKPTRLRRAAYLIR